MISNYTDNFCLMINYEFAFNEYISIFPLPKSNAIFFAYFSYLVKDYKYWKQSTNTGNCTPLSQSDCRYFFVFAINEFTKILGP